MKSLKLFMAVFAAAALVVACQSAKEDLGVARLTVTPTEINLAQAGGSQEITLLATRDWTLYSELPAWLALSATDGVASTKEQTIRVTALANEGHNREFEIVFTIGLAKARLKVIQPGAQGELDLGDGSKEKPFSVAGAIAYIQSLGKDVNSPKKVYIKGKISEIGEAYSSDFGNGTFYITDDGNPSDVRFYAYRIYYLGNRKWKTTDPQIQQGDDVIIYGNVVNYKGNTPETVQKEAFLYEHNGKNEGGDEGGGGTDPGTPEGDGTQASPYNVAAAINAVKNLTWTSNTDYQKTGQVYVKGKISRIADNGTFGQSGTYGNASFYISEDGATTSTEFYCFRILYLGNKKYVSGTDIAVGDDVIICGSLMNYRGNTPETVASEAFLYSLNGVSEGGSGGGGGNTDPGTPEGNGTLDSPYNAAAANNAVKDLTWTSNTDYQKTDPVYVKGKISRIADNGTFGQSGTYGNASFYISDDGATTSAEFYCFRIKYLGNTVYTTGTDIAVGDDVIIYGSLMNYKGNTPETVAGEACLYSLNGVTEGSEPEPYVKISSFRQTASGVSAAWSTNLSNPGFQWYLYKGEVKDETLVASDYTEESALEYDVELEVGATYWFAVTADSDDVEDYVNADPVSFVARDMTVAGDAVEIDLTNKTTWTAETDATYGKGYTATVSDVKVAFYKYKSTTDPKEPDAYSARVYKSSVFVIIAPSGKKLSKVYFTANDYESGKYCVDLDVLEGGSGTLTADVSAMSIGPWEGSADKLVLQAAKAQARLQSIKVVFE